jgi:hypothetical protein
MLETTLKLETQSPSPSCKEQSISLFVFKVVLHSWMLWSIHHGVVAGIYVVKSAIGGHGRCLPPSSACDTGLGCSCWVELYIYVLVPDGKSHQALVCESEPPVLSEHHPNFSVKSFCALFWKLAESKLKNDGFCFDPLTSRTCLKWWSLYSSHQVLKYTSQNLQSIECSLAGWAILWQACIPLLLCLTALDVNKADAAKRILQSDWNLFICKHPQASVYWSSRWIYYLLHGVSCSGVSRILLSNLHFSTSDFQACFLLLFRMDFILSV